MAPSRSGVRSRLLMTQLCLSVIAYIALGLICADRVDGDSWIRIGSIAFVAQGAWAFRSWYRCTGRLVDGYAIFLLALLLFSGGQMALTAIGVLPDGLLYGRFSDWTTLRAVALVNACFASFHLGALLVGRRAPPANPSGVSDVSPLIRYRIATIRAFGVALLSVSAPAMALQTYEALRLASVGGYLALYQQEVRVGLQNWHGVLATFFPPALLMVFAASSQRPQWRRICWVLASVYIAANFVVGSRAVGAMLMAPMLLLQHTLVAPLRRTTLITLAVVTLLLFAVIAQFRILRIGERGSLAAVGGGDPMLVATVREMGGTMTTIAHTIDLVPQVRPYDDGIGYVLALTSAVPNVIGELHPGARGSKYSQWLIAEVDPMQAAAGGGMGFSMIAEAYANFSWVGAPLVMLAFGLCLGGVVQWARRQPLVVGMTMEATLLAAIITLPRGESANSVRGVVWFVVIPTLLTSWYARHRRANPNRLA